MRALVLLAALGAAALAQAPPFPAPPPADGPKQPVAGRVVNAETGQPVRGAKVALVQGRSELASAYSDGEGRFRIEQAPVGEWPVSIEKSGYARIMERVSVPAAQPLTGVELKIHRHSVITGRVLDHRDRPVVGAQVVALAPRFEEGETVLRPASAGAFGHGSNDRGEYRLWNLSPGPHIVAVFPPAGTAPAGVLRFETSGAFYPNAATLAEAERIQVDWGQVREGVDLRLDPPAKTRTTIQAALPDGRQTLCETCSLQILFADEQIPLPVGRTELGPGNVAVVEGLLPGRYLAALRGVERATSSMWFGMAPFEVSEGKSEPVVVAASGEVPVRGRVVLEDRPADRQGEPFRSGLRAMPPRRNLPLGMMTRGLAANLQIEGPEAAFELSCFPGEYDLQLLSRGEPYIAGVTLNGRPLDSAKLAVPAGGVPEGLIVRIRFDPGAVEGKLEGLPAQAGAGLGPPEYAVFARPADPGKSFARSRFLRVLPDGTFREQLPPGKYEIVAFPAGRGVVPPPETEMRELARRVEVKAGETTQVALPVPPKR